MTAALVKKIKFVQIPVILFFSSISCLVTVPVHDDLLGPGQCPTGSFCIDTSYCTNEYYTTKSGLPFYCGPTHQIDSMICCVSTSAAVVQPPRTRNQDQDNEEPFEFNDLEQIIRLNRSASDDDEVDILSLPFATNQIDENPYDDVALPSSNAELEGRFNTPRDLEAMLEDAIEQEVTTPEQGAQEDELGNILKKSAITDGIMEGLETNQIRDNSVNEDSVGARAPATLTFPEKDDCSCRGPKGDPGEPGQIIYVPVFVGASSYSATYAPNQNGFPQGYVPQPFNPALMSNQGQPVPQHPNPTIIPYSVPINIPTGNNPSPPPQPVPPVIVTPLPHPQQPPKLQTPQPSSSIPYADSLQARLTRHAAASAKRQEQRNFYGRTN